MKRGFAVVFIGILVAAGLATPGSAELLESYDLVVVDAAPDAMNYLAPGVHVSELPGGVTRLSTEKQDITSLEMATEPDVLQVKLNLMSFYGGTSSLLFVVHFKVDGTPYFTCWNINSAGVTNNYQDLGENMDLGCSKFNSQGTRVGPATRADGVDSPSSGDAFYVRWEVPKSEIGDPADGVALTDVWAETWNRGLNADSAPSTSPQSNYVWNRADRAPDEGVVGYVLGGGPAEISLALTASPAEQTVGPGSVVPVSLETVLTGGGDVNISFTAEQLPAGWEARFSPDVASLNATANRTNSSLQVIVDPAAENGTYPFTVTVTAPGANASANVTITVDRSMAASGADEDEATPGPSNGPDAEGNGTAADGNGTALGSEEGGALPAPGVVPAALVAVAAALGLRRRGRGTNL